METPGVVAAEGTKEAESMSSAEVGSGGGLHQTDVITKAWGYLKRRIPDEVNEKQEELKMATSCLVNSQISI